MQYKSKCGYQFERTRGCVRASLRLKASQQLKLLICHEEFQHAVFQLPIVILDLIDSLAFVSVLTTSTAVNQLLYNICTVDLFLSFCSFF